ncbi:unnamed protein product [Blepharisma stoltei]|uniref:Uncharacterized protein n=1 Tax=Blepharisma stoltei TaxID=1481888 RepID=A0AAU9JIJ6_9CILI|nr:unnamed protein product [Blepharisma stoltei]
MRTTWLVNENKAYPWDQTPIFREPTQQFKPTKKLFEKVFESTIFTKNNTNETKHRIRSFSPQRQEENSQSWRVINLDNSFQSRVYKPRIQRKINNTSLDSDLMPKVSDKSMRTKSPRWSYDFSTTIPDLIDKSDTASVNSIRTVSKEGRTIYKNAGSENNPLNSSLNDIYKERNLYSPTQSHTSRKKPINIKTLKPKGTETNDSYDIIKNSPTKPPIPNARSKIKRNTMTTFEAEMLNGSRESSPRKARAPSPGREQWRSTMDIIKDAFAKIK